MRRYEFEPDLKRVGWKNVDAAVAWMGLLIGGLISAALIVWDDEAVALAERVVGPSGDLAVFLLFFLSPFVGMAIWYAVQRIRGVR